MSQRQAHINLSALQHNFNQVRLAAPNSAVLAMIKSNAYGHGLQRVALALTDADAFGVASFDEVEALRKADIQKPIMLMTGFYSIAELTLLQQLNTMIVVHNPQQMAMLAQHPLTTPIKVWLKVDLGMSRLGFAVDEIEDVLKQLQANRMIDPEIVLFGHFSDCFDLQSIHTIVQLAKFQELATRCGLPCSLSNSAAILTQPAAHYQWVRPGIMLYGVSPCDERAAADFNLLPVMTLKSRLLRVNHLAKGARVSYGGNFVCPEAMPVGVVEMGYGDGYPRHAENGTPILVNGHRCAIIGRVCMEMLMVDLRNAPDASVGDDVILWGDQLPIEEVATSAKTIGYELLCKVTQRVKKVYE